jgi:adenosylhomocysteine nucleosidase
MNQLESTLPRCDLLVLVATSSEFEALKNVAKRNGCDFQSVTDAKEGRYFNLGKLGDDQTIAVHAKAMGALAHRGSADLAMRFRRATQATTIVQLGMAFGVDPKGQNYGDVLVSSYMIPYDNRRYVERETGGYRVDYSGASAYQAGNILERFQREANSPRSNRHFSVHVGAILSGSARIQSETFRNELVASVPQVSDKIVGGEMEAIGLLGVSRYPIWCVVKGISDFADSHRDEVIAKTRPLACENAAEFLFSTLLNPPSGDII